MQGSTPTRPFINGARTGGYRSSGFGGRDKGLEAFDQYTEQKTIWYNLSEGQ